IVSEEVVEIGMMLLAAGVGLLVHTLLYLLAGRAVKHTQSVVDDSLFRHSRRPLGVILPVAAVQVVVPSLSLPAEILGLLRHFLGLVQIVAVSWLVTRLLRVLDDVLADRYRLDVADNLTARRIHTQLRVLKRIVTIVVGLVALSLVLMTFPTIRQVGATLLASAGVAGLVAGLAARPLLSNLIAGVQIALTQPIRLDDVVIVEGEWGKIEEISATYVVVRIWDNRRLVVPLNYFNEKPFQNWTRTTADLLGTVFVSADYSVPVEEVRQELKRILEGSGMWDGKVWGLQVTDTSEHTVQLRALMSAPDSSVAWDLRCHVREKLIAFLQERHPECLPKTRALLEESRSEVTS
ncbi:MAG: mechanosensitive ion channel family protein, partial [Planctomycetota bacterium]